MELVTWEEDIVKERKKKRKKYFADVQGTLRSKKESVNGKVENTWIPNCKKEIISRGVYIS